jgi:hypothetical protein
MNHDIEPQESATEGTTFEGDDGLGLAGQYQQRRETRLVGSSAPKPEARSPDHAVSEMGSPEDRTSLHPCIMTHDVMT